VSEAFPHRLSPELRPAIRFCRVEDAELVALHAEGLSDNAISRRSGVCQSTVSRRLRALGLEAHGLAPGRDGGFERDPEMARRLRELHAAGASDPEIAAGLGVHPRAAFRARRAMGLAAQGVGGRRAAIASPEDVARFRELAAGGASGSDLARAFGVSRSAAWRALRKLRAERPAAPACANPVPAAAPEATDGPAAQAATAGEATAPGGEVRPASGALCVAGLGAAAPGGSGVEARVRALAAERARPLAALAREAGCSPAEAAAALADRPAVLNACFRASVQQAGAAR
jgi:transposase